MSMFKNDPEGMPERAMINVTKPRPLGATIVLGVVAGLALIAGIVLGVMAGTVNTYNYFSGGVSTSALAQQAAMTTWSNFLLIITVVAGVGAVVLAGVQALMRRAGLSV